MACLFGHKWNGCKCEKCGMTRDEQHHWNGCQCSRCGKVRDKQHDWNYCTCRVCGAKGGIHDWKHSPNSCEEKCSVCGAIKKKNHSFGDDGRLCSCVVCGTKNPRHFTLEHKVTRLPGTCKGACELCGEVKHFEHAWEPVPGKCEIMCSVCGETREQHDWNHCICRICGAKKPSAYKVHDWVPKNSCTYKCSVCGIEKSKEDESAHVWQEVSGCRKMCVKCGAIAYSHAYELIKIVTSGDSYWDGTEVYKCNKCGNKGFKNNKEDGLVPNRLID